MWCRQSHGACSNNLGKIACSLLLSPVENDALRNSQESLICNLSCGHSTINLDQSVWKSKNLPYIGYGLNFMSESERGISKVQYPPNTSSGHLHGYMLALGVG